MTERRSFIKQSLLGTAGVAIGGINFSAKSYKSIIGSNERINVAVVGIGGKGEDHIQHWCRIKDTHNVKLKTICDVDEKFFAERSKKVQSLTGNTPVTEWDMLKVFNDKEIDAVSFATPNHWHALGTIWACQAGKHVYVEKPSSHNIFEGRKMIDAARKYNVRVQVGYQNRSIESVVRAIDFLHKGGIGEVFMAKGLCYKPRDSFGIATNGTPPPSLHYDRWLGPAEMRPYNEMRAHYNWHWFWDTGNGDTGNQGPHQFDIARWGLNKNEHPVSIYSTGGVFGIDPKECAQQTPNTQTTLAKYADGKILEFETRGRYTHTESSLGISIGNIFYGSEGYLELNREDWKAFRNREKEPFESSLMDEKRKKDLNSQLIADSTPHYANFIDAIRAGNDKKLNCDIREGHLSSAIPLMANISYRLGRQLNFEGDKEKFVNDPEADKLTTRNYRKPYIVTEEV